MSRSGGSECQKPDRKGGQVLAYVTEDKILPQIHAYKLMEKIRVNPQLIPVIHALPHGRASDTLAVTKSFASSYNKFQ